MISRSSSLLLALALLVTGCPPAAPPGPAGTAPATTASSGRVTAAEWCAEHGVPEAVCTRCDASLVESYKAKKDWCAEHGLPESQCVTCNPEVAAKWEALAPAR